MDSSAIADRRQLRRKLGFWRLAAVLLLVGLGFALYSAVSGDLGTATRGPQVARVTISGLIQDDSELLQRLKTIKDDRRVRALIVTRGAEGSWIFANQVRLEIPVAAAARIADPTGCGDAYRAGLLHGLAQNMDWESTGRIAALLAAIKIEQHGTQQQHLGITRSLERQRGEQR